jgi:hypothetical protein
MPVPLTNNPKLRRIIAWYLLELAVYAVFVTAYYLVVLHYLSGWLKWLFDEHLSVYAVVALAVILAQAVLLELVTAGLAGLSQYVRRKSN